MKQSEIFLSSEGDGFFRRNQPTLAELDRTSADDQVVRAVGALPAPPKLILEIGCSNGWRLDRLQRNFGAQCHGIDPSAEAISQGKQKYPNVALTTGTAERLPYSPGSFELVIFGFCLYLCDRQDLFNIAAEADRVLRDRGHLMILDFYAPRPYHNRYKHFEGVLSYKMDHSTMFLWNPAYTLIEHRVFADQGGDFNKPDERLSMSVLFKDVATAYPANPYQSDGGPR